MPPPPLTTRFPTHAENNSRLSRSTLHHQNVSHRVTHDLRDQQSSEEEPLLVASRRKRETLSRNSKYPVILNDIDEEPVAQQPRHRTHRGAASRASAATPTSHPYNPIPLHHREEAIPRALSHRSRHKSKSQGTRQRAGVPAPAYMDVDSFYAGQPDVLAVPTTSNRDDHSSKGKRGASNEDQHSTSTDPEIPIPWSPSPEPRQRVRLSGKNLTVDEAVFQHLDQAPDSTLANNVEPVQPKPEATEPAQLLEGQDPWLAGSYDSLQALSDVSLFPLYGPEQSHVPDDEGIMPSTLRDSLINDPATSHVVPILTTEGHEIIVNPSRAPLSRVKPSSNGGNSAVYFSIPPSIVPQRPGHHAPTALFIQTGVCAYSMLKATASKPVSGGRTINDHRIGIYPIEFEYQRFLQYIATKASKSALRYPFTSGILAFTTKSDGGNTDTAVANYGASPSKSPFHKKKATPSSSSLANPLLHNLETMRFPPSLGFGDKVPILDARSAALPNSSLDLSALHTLPIYRASEVDENSIVTIGFTCNTYASTAPSLSGMDIISLNLQFVVVLADKPRSL
ncbi:hypothetical protein DFP72DRAFT_1078230 [Ephemerocybe angulata]|uniref:Uncharacterized protein n=1 Tax=Ephemerocybe angulata TaxID=980116 RepID=A0A8H6HE84_9AGAR|nr:hypothetical protein DFP72DRAFT_1078230 [Tulosesus angulatus]